MTTNLGVTFFRELHEEGLASNTIASIKSGLKKAFRYGFNMDVNDHTFSEIPRACSNLRPSKPPAMMLSWSLNKVLQLASDTDSDSCDYTNLLRKTLLLIGIASGGRLSEVAALSRDPGHIEFLPSGEVSLTPHVAFLAKNELPNNRRDPWIIVPLPQDTSLCPVATLKTYLDRTSHFKNGRLFQRERGGTLSVAGVRQQILYFIKKADPDSIPKGHEIRKIATSINYFQFMDFESLRKYTGWKSSKVFFKHYYKSLDALKFHVSAVGRVIPPTI